MKQRLTALCIASFVSICSTTVLAEDQASGAAGTDQGASARSAGGGDTGRDRRSTNTEKSDRKYQDEEIADAPPPPNRVRNNPSPR